MTRQLKCFACFLFAVLLLLQTAPVPGRAAPSAVPMISVNDDLMKLEQGKISFWSDGQLYVPHTAFEGIYGNSLGVFYTTTVDPNVVILYDSASALSFNLSNGVVQDGNNIRYPMNAIVNNGTVFLPIDPVSAFFGFTYTYTHTDIAPLIRIKNDAVILSDNRFISVASDLMRRYAKEYEKATDKTVDNQPSAPETVTGQWVYPVFTVTDIEATGQILDILDRWNVQATFLMTAEQMEQNADLLRRMVGTRQAVAIVPGDSVTDDLNRGSEALWAAARATTRFVWLGKDGEKTALPPAFCALRCRLDSSARPLTSTARADALYERISALSAQHVTLFLGDDADNTTALRHFLSKLDAGDCRTLAWRETL